MFKIKKNIKSIIFSFLLMVFCIGLFNYSNKINLRYPAGEPNKECGVFGSVQERLSDCASTRQLNTNQFRLLSRHPDGNEFFIDNHGLVWNHLNDKRMNFKNALRVCKEEMEDLKLEQASSWRLPKASELVRAHKEGIKQLNVFQSSDFYWTSTIHTGLNSDPYIFFPETGSLFAGFSKDSFNQISVVCVSRVPLLEGQSLSCGGMGTVVEREIDCKKQGLGTPLNHLVMRTDDDFKIYRNQQTRLLISDISTRTMNLNQAKDYCSKQFPILFASKSVSWRLPSANELETIKNFEFLSKLAGDMIWAVDRNHNKGRSWIFSLDYQKAIPSSHIEHSDQVNAICVGEEIND